MKKPVRIRIEQWERFFLGFVEKSVQAVKPLVPHLPGFVTWLFLTVGAGWMGGWWAAQSSVAQLVSRAPRDAVPVAQKLASFSSPDSVQAENVRVIPPLQKTSRQAEAKKVEGKPYLGIRGKEIRQGEIQGVRIVEVFPDTPAALAGLRSDRDLAPASSPHSTKQAEQIIIGANGQIVRSEENLAEILAGNAPGSVLTLLVVSSDGRSYEIIPVTLGATPETSSVILTAAEGKNQSTHRETRPRETHH